MANLKESIKKTCANPACTGEFETKNMRKRFCCAKCRNEAKTGRPKIAIDWKSFDKLCQIQATLIEISSFFDCSEDTIERSVKEYWGCNFAVYHKKKAAGGKSSLRRAQFQSAMAGNVTMQIWLGKQHLDQSDKNEVKSTGKPSVSVNMSAGEYKKMREEMLKDDEC